MKFNHKKDFVAYILLSFFLVLFFGFIFYEKIGNRVIALAGIAWVLLAIGFYQVHKKEKHKRYDVLEHYNVILASVIGAVVTYYLSVNLGLGAVIGAGVVGVASVYVCKIWKCAKNLPPPAYMGAFVGMSAPFVLSSLLFVAIAGVVAGMIYALSHEVYTGMGGKLGTIAFSGTAITVFVLGLVL